MPISIRRASLIQLSKISDLIKEDFPIWTLDIVEAEFSRPRNIFRVAVEINEKREIDETDEILGVCVLWRAYDEVHILNIVVSRQHRRKGIARMLLEDAQKVTSEFELERIILEVRVSNDPAIGLYEGLGFKRIGFRKNYYHSPREDAIVLSKTLSKDA